MSDPAVIYLQPECCADEGVGRVWCDVDSPVDCEDGVPWTKYVRADIAERDVSNRALFQMQEAAKDLAAKNAALRARVAQRDAQIAVYNSGGFADADALAEKFIELTARIERAGAERDALRTLLIEARLDMLPGESLAQRIDAALNGKEQP